MGLPRCDNHASGVITLVVESLDEPTTDLSRVSSSKRTSRKAPWETGTEIGSDPTLEAFLVERWVPSRRHSWAEGTVRYRCWAVESVLVPDLGHRRLSQLTTEEIERWIAWRVSMPFTTSGRVPKPGTMRGILTTLNAALNQAVRWRLIEANPMTGVPMPKVSVEVAQIWTADDVQRFFAYVAGSRYEPLWRLLFATGLRRGEALGLQWGDIDFEDRRLRVQRCLLADSREGALLYGPPKSARSRRTVTLDPGTVESLERLHQRCTNEWRAQRVKLERMIALKREDQGKIPVLATTLSTDQPVFVHADGRPLLPATVSDAFRRAVAGAGLPRIRLHDIRHSHLTHLLRSGEPIQNVAARAGHGSPFTTLTTYAHVIAGDDERTALRAAGLFGEQPEDAA